MKVNSKSIFLNATLLNIIIFLIIYLIFLNIHPSTQIPLALIIVYSWISIFIFLFIIFSWKKITGYYFSIYTIFMSFFFSFHFGQPVLWAFNIFLPNQIGKTPLYPGWGVASNYDILLALSFVTVSMLFFHFGAIISTINFRPGKIESSSHLVEQSNHTQLKSIYTFSMLIAFFSIPIQFYVSINDLQTSLSSGYGSLYYSNNLSEGPLIISLLTRMFFPSLLGLLIGSRFKRNIRTFVYIVFAIYMGINLFAGDRGSWLYSLILLILLHHFCVKPLNFKRILLLTVLGLVGLQFVNAIIEVRDYGVSLEAIKSALSFDNSPIVLGLNEMGSSLKPVIILQKYGWDIWPYANTYLLSILGMGSTAIINFLGIQFKLLSAFFSQDYLGLINWGAGFSIVAESLINFGPVFAVIFMILLGWIITKLIHVDFSVNYQVKPIKYFVAFSSALYLIPLIRGISHIQLKDWFYGVFVYVAGVYITNSITKYNSGKSRNVSDQARKDKSKIEY